MALHRTTHTLAAPPLVPDKDRAGGDPTWACARTHTHTHTHTLEYLHTFHHHWEGKKKLIIGNNSVVRP